MKHSYSEYVLQCLVCDRSYQPHEVSYFCPHCKIDGALDALYDYPTLKREWSRDSLAHDHARGMWRYDRLMPLSSTQFIPPLLVMCEQLGWQVPDLVFVPVGNGCILGSVYKGFFDLLQLGWIERIPRLIGVQAEHSNFMYRAWRSDRPMQQIERIAPTSLASSINVALPRDRIKAMRAVKASGGEFICVSDPSIVAAASRLAASTGVFPEAGAASAFAGLLKYAEAHPDTPQTAVILITGSGLKDTSIFLSDSTRSQPRVQSHQSVAPLADLLT